MQLLDGEHLESRWSPCVRWSWAHPCCLLTSSQLGGLNPHTRMGSAQALWACWTATSRFNLPSSFIFIKRHLFFRQLTLPKHNHCDSLFFFSLWTGLMNFREDFSVILFLSFIFTYLNCVHHAHTACLQRVLSISIKYWSANIRVCLEAQPPCWQPENEASLHLICFSKVTRCKDTADSSPWFNE